MIIILGAILYNNNAIIPPPNDNNTGVHFTIGDKNSDSNIFTFIGFTNILFPKKFDPTPRNASLKIYPTTFLNACQIDEH